MSLSDRVRNYNLKPVHFIPYAGAIIYDSNFSNSDAKEEFYFGGGMILAIYNLSILGSIVLGAAGLEKLLTN